MRKKATFEDINMKMLNDDDSLNKDLGIIVDNDALVRHVKDVCSKSKDKEKCNKCPFSLYINAIKDVYEV